METRLVKFIRNKKGQRVGMFVADCVHHKVYIGWSKLKKGDTFDFNYGITKALGRAKSRKLIDFPSSIKDDGINFLHRAHRYFKDCRIVNKPKQLTIRNIIKDTIIDLCKPVSKKSY